MIQNVKKILAPIDFSDYSMQALKGAWDLSKDTGAELHLLHVVVPHHSFLPLPLTLDAERAREIAREAAMVEQAEEELARIRKDDLENSKKVTTAAIVGAPVAKIIEYVKQNSIDLIVMSTHGRSGSELILIGSVTEKLVRLAPCAVLVLRRS
ncbi:MAG TPA: universal stress protein [Candidatus Binataceae bacterium]|nr:universal stress protein [Candidatus Binataceae bacterium]